MLFEIGYRRRGWGSSDTGREHGWPEARGDQSKFVTWPTDEAKFSCGRLTSGWSGPAAPAAEWTTGGGAAPWRRLYGPTV
jgi:hypothetical protein